MNYGLVMTDACLQIFNPWPFSSISNFFSIKENISAYKINMMNERIALTQSPPRRERRC